MKAFQAAVIGLGVGEQHIAGYARDPRVNVTALCDIDEGKRRLARKRYPQARVYDSAEELLDLPEIDMVSVASYDDCHYEQVVRALRNGKSVFVEKPLCQHPDQARHIREELIRHPEAKLSSNLILRKCPRFVRLREMVRNGELGRIFAIEASYEYGRLEKLTDGWRGDLDFYSVTAGGGVHLVDLVLWLLNERVTEVTAFGNRIASAGTKSQHEDYVAALLHFESGAVVKIASNFGCVRPHFHRLDVFGTKATFYNGRDCGELYTCRDMDAQPQRMDEAYPGYSKGDLLSSFVKAVIEGCEPEIGAEDALQAMSICFAIDLAISSPARVPVRYI